MMTDQTINIFFGILIFGTFIYLFVLLIIANIKYHVYTDEVRKKRPSNRQHRALTCTWSRSANRQYIRTPLPITMNTKDPDLKKLIRAHEKVTKLFWVSAITMPLMVIMLLNLMNS